MASVLLSFLGGLIGAGIPAVVAWRGMRQAGRGEWRQRLDAAIGLLTSSDPACREFGDELLADLVRSDLGSPADRELARRIAAVRVRTAAAGGGPMRMDLPPGVSDTSTEDE